MVLDLAPVTVGCDPGTYPLGRSGGVSSVMVSRVDGLLGELKSRHGTEAQFMERLRPMVENILGEDTPDHMRSELLELLAETCDRQVKIQRDGVKMREAFQSFFANIGQLLATLVAERANARPSTKPGTRGDVRPRNGTSNGPAAGPHRGGPSDN